MTDTALSGRAKAATLYTFGGCEFVEIKHVDWQAIIDRLSASGGAGSGDRPPVKLHISPERMKQLIEQESDDTVEPGLEAFPSAVRALDRLHRAIKTLAQFEGQITLFEASPTKSQRAFEAWKELNAAQAVAAATLASPPAAVTALEAAEHECWSIKCESYPTGGDDADVGWEVISHWQAKPHERVEGRGSTPLKALVDAMEKGEQRRIADAEAASPSKPEEGKSAS